MKKIASRLSVFESTVLKYFGVCILVPFHKLDTKLCYGNSRHICSYHKINYTSSLYFFIIRCFL